jgi:rhodanese-related sulfurtransferase
MVQKLGTWTFVAAVAALGLAGAWATTAKAQAACGACPVAAAAAAKDKPAEVVCPAGGVCDNCACPKASEQCKRICEAAKKVTDAGLKFVNATQLQEKVKTGQAPIIVNVLPAEAYTAKRIKGSINIPLKEIAALAPKIIPDKDAEVVVHCANYKCGASIAAGKALKELGYTNVGDYKGGTQEWSEKGLPVEGTEAKAK